MPINWGSITDQLQGQILFKRPAIIRFKPSSLTSSWLVWKKLINLAPEFQLNKLVRFALFFTNLGDWILKLTNLLRRCLSGVQDLAEIFQAIRFKTNSLAMEFRIEISIEFVHFISYFCSRSDRWLDLIFPKNNHKINSEFDDAPIECK